MKKTSILIFVYLTLCVEVFSSNSNFHLSQIKYLDDQSKKKTYCISNDTMKVVFNVIIYSKAIINYNISIVTKKRKIEQNGYALNLTSEINGGIEYETDDTSCEISVVPYNTYYCDCDEKYSFEFRIASDEKKVNIYSSRKLRCDLFNENPIEPDKSKDSVPLFGYLYQKK